MKIQTGALLFLALPMAAQHVRFRRIWFSPRQAAVWSILDQTGTWRSA